MWHIYHCEYYFSNEEVKYHCNQSCNRCSTDDSYCCFPAVRDQSQDKDGGKESNHTAADILPTQPDYGRIDIEAGCTRGVQEEVPADPTHERCNAGYSETTLPTSPRPHSKSSRGKHTGDDSRNIRHMFF
jgi:hypothetical protein